LGRTQTQSVKPYNASGVRRVVIVEEEGRQAVAGAAAKEVRIRGGVLK